MLKWLVMMIALSVGCGAASTPPSSSGSNTTAEAASGPSRFSVEVNGHGPDVIFVPGLGSNREVWRAQADALVATHRVHLVQVAGFAGEPAIAPTEHVIEPLVEELASYIATNHIERPAFIGHSMGGLTGLMLARRHPERIGRLMIVDALPFYSAMFGPQVTAQSVEPQARALRDRISALDEAGFAAQQDIGVARLIKTSERRADVLQWSITSDRAVFGQAMYEVMTIDMRPEVANVQTPITVVYAYDPEMGPETFIDDLYRDGYQATPNVTFVRVDGSFHFIMFDQPAALQAAVEEFLR